MKLSDYIKQLQEIEKEYGGDIEVGICHQDGYTYKKRLVSPCKPIIHEIPPEDPNQNTELVAALGFETDY